MGDMLKMAYNGLTQEDLQKLKHWGEKRQMCKSPHCGERCVITERKEEKWKQSKQS
jgi:hypothetical protein